MSEADLPEFNRAQLRAIEVLRGGGAVVVTNPSPMTYGVVARDARALNRLKGRPADQPVGVSVHSQAAHDQLFRFLDLPTDALAAVDFALAERITVLAPIRSDPAMPEWLAAPTGPAMPRPPPPPKPARSSRPTPASSTPTTSGSRPRRSEPAR
ncbi:hypothetical protein ACFWUU_05935 [Kribbella sp. NPDC058693]|uniref:hypothetical protein n=1 Tax=Kribbella sp. NPDC058693 TaxID=3346602 RepID=UPI00365F10D5